MRRSFAAVAVVVVAAVGLSGSVLSAATSSSAVDDRSAADTAAARQLAETTADRALAEAVEALAGAAPETGESVTLALRDLSLALPDLDPTERKRAHALLARPTNGPNDDFGDGYTVPSKKICSKKICVHWVSSTADAPPSRAWVNKNLAVMKKTWAHEVGKLGYRTPVKDGTRGGNSKFDVYLKDVGSEGYYGYCAKERLKPGTRWMASGYCVLDNDFSRAEFGAKPAASLRVTAAHEFFHAIQFAYDYAEDGWMMEATATWMEERVADGLDDNRRYLPHGQVARPAEALDLYNSGGFNHYGNWAFFEYLSTRFGKGVVRKIWNNADGNYRNHSIKAVGKALPRRRSFAGVFRAYAAANTIPGRTYPEGGSWPSAPMAASRTLTAGAPSASGDFRVNHLAARHLAITPGDALRTKAWRVRVSVNGPERKTNPAAYVIVHKKNGKLEKNAIKLDRLGDGKAVFRFSKRLVKRATVTLANASRRYNCWEQQLTYSCQGIPKDQGRHFAWKVKVFKR